MSTLGQCCREESHVCLTSWQTKVPFKDGLYHPEKKCVNVASRSHGCFAQKVVVRPHWELSVSQSMLYLFIFPEKG